LDVGRYPRHALRALALPPKSYASHALRHFAISCWIAAGLPPKTVQTFAGHSSLQVTMDRYGHLFRSDDHGRAIDAIASEIHSTAEPVRPTDTAPATKPGFKPQNG
jgi:integrase